MLLLRLGGGLLDPDSPASATPVPVPAGSHWIATWGAAPQAATGGNLSRAGFRDATIREIVFTSAGGVRVRVRLTNAFGSAPLRIGGRRSRSRKAGRTIVGGHLTRAVLRRPALGGDPARGRGDERPGAAQGARRDPARDQPVSPATHRSRDPARRRPAGQLRRGRRPRRRFEPGRSDRTRSWYFLDGVDVLGARRALARSSRSATRSPTASARRSNERALAERPRRAGSTTAGAHARASSTRASAATASCNNALCCGVNASRPLRARRPRQPGARDVILLEGINDIGYSQNRGPLTAPHTDVSALQIVEGYERIIALAHTAGLKIFGATLTPFEGARYWTRAARPSARRSTTGSAPAARSTA